MSQAKQFAICVHNGEYAGTLDLRKVYEVLEDESAAKRQYMRVIDESGEDYLYHSKGFEILQLPQRTERKVLATLR